ncbi:HlyD family type I secretion periplasmic adaptor subunit [Roseovarius tolerans]|uniref:HlyD family type I secretion periplasmic adaptor subunit n=1 Tax=Roseovarius tolerans TaxID=74031 RepID=UPI00067F586D|nr:HlyD family type I secretion periplasmic adaptor subunit [Roseovarius tolerans]
MKSSSTEVVETKDEWHRDVPRSITKHVIFGLCLFVFAFGGFGLWAFRAPLAAAVITPGSFVATGRNKIVQHLEGGFIHEILVQEGDHVKAGDILVRLDHTAAEANKRELTIRRARLEATSARLLAEYRKLDEIVFPTELLEMAQDDFEVAGILDGQRLAFEVARSSLDNDLELLSRNIAALDVRATGYTTQLDSYHRLVSLLIEEHEDKKNLFKEGLVRKSEVNALHRALIQAEGQTGRIQAEVHETQEHKTKHLKQKDKAVSLYRETALDELQIIQSELESVREKSRKAENILIRSEIRAPVSGTVIRLHYVTSGGVIEPGKPIAEILPTDAPLIIETLIPRTDIDSVQLGQKAIVRLTALNIRTTPVLNGTVDYISGDAVTESTDGIPQEVYVARISLSAEELSRVGDFVPTPGMPAEVMIQTATRTFAQYIAKPVADSMTRAFREQ